MSRSRRPDIVLLAVLVGGLAAGADDTVTDGDSLRRRGLAALPEILPLVDSSDPAVRLRARRLAKRIVMDHLEASAPSGMRLVPGRLVVSRDGVRMEKGHYLSTHEITVGEFRRFAAATGLPDDRWADDVPTLPVTQVSLEEARAFAKWRGGRVPTLPELEWAATSGGRFRYPWGDHFDPARVNSREAGRGAAEAVGSRRGGYSAHGIADLRGNVAEWTETATGKSGTRRFRVVGGSYRGYARHARFVTYSMAPQARLEDVGFRVARSLPPLAPDG